MACKLCAFVDESGNTGNVNLTKKQFLNYLDQPTFALAGILVPEDKLQLVRAQLIVVLKTKLHRSREAKSVKELKNNPALIIKTLDILRKAGCVVYVEQMDKEFYIVVNFITSFLVRYDHICQSPFKDSLIIKQVLVNHADILMRNLPKKFYESAVTLFNCRDEKSFYEFVDVLLSDFSRDVYPDEFYNMIMAFYVFFNERLLEGDDVGDLLNFLLPSVGFQLNKKQAPLLPHEEAFFSIVARMEWYRKQRRYASLVVCHDEQNEFRPIIERAWSHLKLKSQTKDEVASTLLGPKNGFDYNISPQSELVFEDSKKEPLLQASDLISGAVNSIWKCHRNGQVLSSHMQTIFRLLNDFNDKSSMPSVHWVTETAQTKSLFKKYDSSKYVTLS